MFCVHSLYVELIFDWYNTNHGNNYKRILVSYCVTDGYLRHSHSNNNSLITKRVQFGVHIKRMFHFFLSLQNNTAGRHKTSVSA